MWLWFNCYLWFIIPFFVFWFEIMFLGKIRISYSHCWYMYCCWKWFNLGCIGTKSFWHCNSRWSRSSNRTGNLPNSGSLPISAYTCWRSSSVTSNSHLRKQNVIIYTIRKIDEILSRKCGDVKGIHAYHIMHWMHYMHHIIFYIVWPSTGVYDVNISICLYLKDTIQNE